MRPRQGYAAIWWTVHHSLNLLIGYLVYSPPNSIDLGMMRCIWKNPNSIFYISGDNSYLASLSCGTGIDQNQIMSFFWRDFLFSFFYPRNGKKWRNLCYLTLLIWPSLVSSSFYSVDLLFNRKFSLIWMILFSQSSFSQVYLQIKRDVSVFSI